ncbi:MAG TPA: DUF4278 domain-containing protein [Trichocoleus sp.]
MQLIYRGVPYEVDEPTLQVTDANNIGVHRGVSSAARTYTQTQRSVAGSRLTYRGVPYLR